MTPAAMLGGFVQPSTNAAHAFRAALEVMARPGRIEDLLGAEPPQPMSMAAGGLILTLCDPTTPVHLAGAHDCAALRDWITFHTGAPLVGAEQAQFAIGPWAALTPVDRFAIGQPDYPDRSATLIVEMDLLSADGPRLTGPGIKGAVRLSLPEITAFADNAALFPLGFDCFLTAGVQVAGLPRSTRVEDF